LRAMKAMQNIKKPIGRRANGKSWGTPLVILSEGRKTIQVFKISSTNEEEKSVLAARCLTTQSHWEEDKREKGPMYPPLASKSMEGLPKKTEILL